MNENKFASLQKRAIQYWFVDGLAELAAGLVSLFLALLFWIWQVIFTWRWSLPFVLFAGLLVSFGLRLIIQRIKERTTYRRTGYVSPPSGLENKRALIVMVVFTLILLAFNYIISTQGPQALLWSPAMAGLAFTFIFVFTGIFTKLHRFYLLAGFSLCLGVILALIGMDYLRGMGVLAGVVGVTLLVQGSRVHKTYINQNPPSCRYIDE